MKKRMALLLVILLVFLTFVFNNKLIASDLEICNAVLNVPKDEYSNYQSRDFYRFIYDVMKDYYQSQSGVSKSTKVGGSYGAFFGKGGISKGSYSQQEQENFKKFIDNLQTAEKSDIYKSIFKTDAINAWSNCIYTVANANKKKQTNENPAVQMELLGDIESNFAFAITWNPNSLPSGQYATIERFSAYGDVKCDSQTFKRGDKIPPYQRKTIMCSRITGKESAILDLKTNIQDFTKIIPKTVELNESAKFACMDGNSYECVTYANEVKKKLNYYNDKCDKESRSCKDPEDYIRVQKLACEAATYLFNKERIEYMQRNHHSFDKQKLIDPELLCSKALYWSKSESLLIANYNKQIGNIYGNFPVIIPPALNQKLRNYSYLFYSYNNYLKRVFEQINQKSKDNPYFSDCFFSSIRYIKSKKIKNISSPLFLPDRYLWTPFNNVNSASKQFWDNYDAVNWTIENCVLIDNIRSMHSYIDKRIKQLLNCGESTNLSPPSRFNKR